MSDGAQARLIALDWGTSSLRALLLGDGGRVLEQRHAPLGIMQVPTGGFPAAFDQVAGDWRRAAPALPAIAAGMIGSANGWREAAYCRGEAGIAEIAARLVVVDTGLGAPLHIVPGLAIDAPRPEVMRGEETQIFGALSLHPSLRGDATLLLPGTHSKWVALREGRILGFQTFMTGELFAVLRQHSILGRLAPSATAPADDASFDAGVAAARASRDGVAPLLFSARSRVLLGKMPAAASLDYLSGLLIGDELRAALIGRPLQLALIGDAALCGRYRRALSQFDAPQAVEVDGAAQAGLWQIALAARLLQ